MEKNPPNESTLAIVRSWLRRGEDLQQTRRHVVRHHGLAEWLWLSTSDTQRHGRERAQVARWLRDIRKIAAHNGYAPREVFSLARGN